MVEIRILRGLLVRLMMIGLRMFGAVKSCPVLVVRVTEQGK